MVNFFFENTEEFELDGKFYHSWLSQVCLNEGRALGELSLILCSDDYLLDINKKYLNHDYYTDIITFNYTLEEIKGDLFISVDRVAENAEKQGVRLLDELNRVIVHGTLHLLGYTDNTPENKVLMTDMENRALDLIVSRET